MERIQITDELTREALQMLLVFYKKELKREAFNPLSKDKALGGCPLCVVHPGCTDCPWVVYLQNMNISELACCDYMDALYGRTNWNFFHRHKSFIKLRIKMIAEWLTVGIRPLNADEKIHRIIE